MKIFYEKIEFPLKGPPPGAEKIDRWYQLDAPAAALVEFWSRQKLNEKPRPGTIVLASPHGCNESDEAFEKTQLTSPQKFVHTLPNVRATSLCQLLNWRGPLLCVQKDPVTFSAALELGADLLTSGASPFWVIGVKKEKTSVYGVILFELIGDPSSSIHQWLSLTDRDLWSRVEANSTRNA